MSEYDDGRAVGRAEGYIEAISDQASAIEIMRCICGVAAGGARVLRKGCPMCDPDVPHPPQTFVITS